MKDNYIAKEVDPSDEDLLSEYHEKGKLHPDFLPFITYDMVQMGYPYPDHGAMVARPHGGTDENDILQPSTGMWMKVEDFKEFMEATKEIFDIKEFITLLNTRHKEGISIETIAKKYVKI